MIDLNRLLHYLLALTWGVMLAIWVHGRTVKEYEPILLQAERSHELLSRALDAQVELLEAVNGLRIQTRRSGP